MKKISLGLGSLAAVLALLGFAADGAQAYRGDPAVKGPDYSLERHEAMQKAFADRDYDAWADLMQGRGRVTQVVNESNFSRFAEAHDLALQGRTAEAQQIRQELGLGMQDGAGRQNRANR